jgi:hypothetical protein
LRPGPVRLRREPGLREVRPERRWRARGRHLALEPTGDGKPFTVELSAGRYAVEWFDVGERRVVEAAPIDVATDGPAAFVAPFAERPAVLYVRRVAD